MPKTKDSRVRGDHGACGWEGWAREAFGKKEEEKEEGTVERREREDHPPTQTLKNQERKLRVGEGVVREAFG